MTSVSFKYMVSIACALFVDSRLLNQSCFLFFFVVAEMSREIFFAGAAFRRVFSILVVLFALLECQEQDRILLLEDPETALHPSLYRPFLNKVLSLADEQPHKVQVVIVSNARALLEILPSEVPYARHFFT